MAATPPRRTGTLIVGAVIFVIGMLIAFGYRVGSCVDGPTVSTCTSGPAPYALLVGFAVAGAGVVVALLGLRRRRG